MSFFTPLITRDSDGTIFEVLGEGKDYEGKPKVFISQQGSVGWHRVTQDQLWVNFTAYPTPPHVHNEDCMCVMVPMEVEGAHECHHCGGHTGGPCGDRCDIARAEVIARG
ncbi:hypothetical protein BBK82_03620 [Lentzea guizhouensis]|uniref:Uncharacterized protein n=1 Tax=Lentzea guizhouensis TaxID=1586287 RepID=A0A1B2HC59_9PSEU|nr:hypothetical protein [Lentzea guizhouensis]ANZ35305.1 hypothetical protein BBK82_03620 [Lentzea guizhouensis]